ncbi:MAG: ANTAR domain-containing protein [Hyphomonadaceae bacterium]|nr:ANTAR domain-containing protein [Clostridia bacterium]
MRQDIMIAVNNANTGSQIKSLLTTNGFAVGDICTSGNDAIRKARLKQTELLILNFDLSDMTGVEVSKILGADELCSIILLTSETQKEFVDDKVAHLDLVCISKPINKTILLQAVEVMLKTRKKIVKLKAEVMTLKEDIKTRKMIEKAKGLLMEKLGMSENEAYRKIQKNSMDSGVTMKDIAKVIVDTMQ